MSVRTIAVVPARAGSRRLPGKNLRPMAGRPMIAWTLDVAMNAGSIDRVVVSTDSPQVADLTVSMGLPPALMRPAELSGDSASVMDVIAHALDATSQSWDLVVLLQPTSPLRRVHDIDAAVDLCLRSGAPAVISVSRPIKPAAFHAGVDASGRLLGMPADFEQVRVINGAVYVGRPDVVLAARSFQVAGCLAYEMPADRGWDVDDGQEFAACEARLLEET